MAGAALLAAACGGGGDDDDDDGSAAVAGLTAYQQAVAYAQCMRAHGLPSFPDPIVNAGGVTFQGFGGVRPSSTQVQSAMQACQRFNRGFTVMSSTNSS